MNTLTNVYSRPSRGPSAPTVGTTTWLGAGGCALTVAVIALLTVPGPLVAPTIAASLFLGSVIPIVATRNAAQSRREAARLFAGAVFAIGILASVLTDIDSVVTYLR